ncbi:MAG: hypothetical protein ONB46_13885 [candidate division KSB1 bacterium]|nr:hypothetical protein [candidate division KSB1 bacterium]MDZ7366971.1 hypothetical protein [candidate division KSB1 bacterium]MDZ7406856.1 hypothetical protein [candidate division KSB1 bacterium]
MSLQRCKSLLLVLAAFLSYEPAVVAARYCSIYAPPPTKFDSLEYVFIGRVIGMVGPLHSPKVHGEAWGLLVRVKEKVYLPQFPKGGLFELFIYHLRANCSAEGISREVLAERFFDREIRIIARESQFFNSRLANGNMRLEAWAMNRGEVAINYAHEELFSSASSVFDYKKYAENFKIYRNGNFQILGDKIKSSRKDLFLVFASFEKLRNFELRKDLLRLERAGSEAKRLTILKRLIYLPDDSPRRFVSEVARRYLKDEKTIKSILETAPYNQW